MDKDDEIILYESYQKMVVRYQKKAKQVRVETDKKRVAELIPMVSLLLIRLGGGLPVTSMDVQKHIIEAKHVYMNIERSRKRNSICVPNSLIQSEERLIRMVAKCEAELIRLVRESEIGGDRINLKEILSKEKYYRNLKNRLARDIVKESLADKSNSSETKGNIKKFFVMEEDDRYHIKECPYCKDATVVAVSREMVEYQNLKPCQCILDPFFCGVQVSPYVTVFVDEAIRHVNWTETGEEGLRGSYSYIACWGNLANENDIQEDMIITQGVDYLEENRKTGSITETAIGKVMLMLAYDYNFSGNLQIYTDNMGAKDNWLNSSRNMKLAKLFENVSVTYIPRDRNTKADQLGRTKVYLCLATSVYDSIVRKCAEYDSRVDLLSAKIE